MNRRRASVIVFLAVVLGACDADDDDNGTTPDPTAVATPTTISASTGATPIAPPTTAAIAVQRYPDIVDAVASHDTDDDTWSFAVTMSSPYDTPERYADGWRIVGPDGTVYGVHTLAHDHANEQPFTRRQTGVVVPDDVDRVTIEGRDQVYGFGGTTLTISLQTGPP